MVGDPISDIARGRDIFSRLERLERAMEMLSTARTAEASTIGAGGLRSSDFDGDLDTGTPGRLGWGLGSGRFYLLGAPLTPVEFAANGTFATNFPLSTSWATKTQISFTAPDWADEVSLHATTAASLKNTTASSDVAEIRITLLTNIGGSTTGHYVSISPGVLGHVSASGSAQFSISGGEVITIGTDMKSDLASWGADASNVIGLDVSLYFRRVP